MHPCVTSLIICPLLEGYRTVVALSVGIRSTVEYSVPQRKEMYKEAQAAPPPSPIGGIRDWCGSRAYIVCKI
jgi:hypothetical protein